MLNVRPQIPLAFAAAGSFQVHDAMHPQIDLRNIVCAACFQQHCFSGISQRTDQWKNIFLQERLAAGDFDQRTIEFQNFSRNLGQRFLFAFVKGIGGVAISAAQVAEGQPHKHAWKSRPSAFTLNRVIDLVNSQRCGARFSDRVHWKWRRSRMANHNITAAVMASVPTCQLGWEKTCAPNLTAVHKTTPQVSAPRTTADRDAEGLSHTCVLCGLAADNGQPESDAPRTHQYDKDTEQKSAAPPVFWRLKLKAAMGAIDFPRSNSEVGR